MNPLIAFFVLIFSFYALSKIVDAFFVETLEIISKRLKLSPDIAGATFMAVGSSAPELFVAILALFKVSAEQQSMGAGTIVGSAIFNILVIIGASALVKRAKLTWQPVIRDMVFYIFSIILLIFVLSDGRVTLLDAGLFVGYYVIYLFSFKLWGKIFPYTSKDFETDDLSEDEKDSIYEAPWTLGSAFEKMLSYIFFNIKKYPNMYLVNFLISIILIALVSNFMVESAVGLAHFFHISEVIIGLTILAAGTSIPDLMASLNVARKGRGDMAISNAVGSNIFDIAIGLGVPWFAMIIMTGKNIVADTTNLASSIILLFSTVLALLFLLIAKRWELGRFAGVLLILIYVYYIISQIGIISTELCLNIGSGWCFVL